METSSDTLYSLKVPKYFFDDHCDRGCVEGQYEEKFGIVKSTKTHYFLKLNEADAKDLLSDADYYATGGFIQESREWLGQVSSARATKKATALQLHEQGVQFSEWEINCWGLRHIIPVG